MLNCKAVTALLYAATGAPAHPANIAAGLARLDKLLRARGIDRERPDAAAILLRYIDRAATPESTWAALLNLAPGHVTPAAAQPAPTTARTGAQRYRLPAKGTKYRLALDLMRRSGGATNREICAATGIDASWAVDGRRWAERYGLTFVKETIPGPKSRNQALYKLMGKLPDELMPDIVTTAT